MKVKRREIYEESAVGETSWGTRVQNMGKGTIKRSEESEEKGNRKEQGGI